MSSLAQAQTSGQRATNVYTLDKLPASNNDAIRYRLVPHSRIIMLSKKYRMVFLVDVTSSLAAVDYYTNNMIFTEAIETYVLVLVLQSGFLKFIDVLRKPILFM
jgi:hypothetical protein